MQREVKIKEMKSETLEEFLQKLEKSEQDYKEGRVHDARAVFEELKKKYGL